MDGHDEASRRVEQVRLSGATELDLSNLELTELPNTVTQLSGLKTADLSNNQLAKLPEDVGALRSLTKLSIAENRLDELPETLGECRDLQFLDIHGNYLKSLPEEVGHLRHIRELNVANNEIEILPDAFQQLTCMHSLDLSKNRIYEINVLRYLLRLNELYLLSNRLSAMPECLQQLAALEKLSLADNNLVSIPEFVGDLHNLKQLYMNDNQLTTVPDAICQLIHLQVLYLNHNCLTILPESLWQLPQLEKLHIDHNNISSLSEAIGRLQNLAELHANKNSISVLPNSIGQLTQLRVLNLSDNQIIDFPEEMCNLNSLRTLHLGPNPCLIEELGDTLKPAEKLEVYFRTRRGSRPLMEAKLIIVGRGGVGKTSLVNRLLRDTFNPSEAKTEGIAITPWLIQLRRGEHARLHVWDFGGQDILHATHQFFLTHRTLYVLVLSGREGSEDRDAQYWLNLLASLAPDSPVIVVLNKYHEYPFDVNRRGVQEKFANVRRFVVTDCKESIGIATLRQTILEETDRLEHLREPFPAAWFRIKDRLAGMRENYLSYAKYQMICRELGEPASEAQDTLASVLHALGIALNYKDDPRLRDMHVLNPRWVTEAIYGILNAPVLAERFGELNIDDLAAILDSTDYPGHRHSFLIDLMHKFELCIRIPDRGTHRYLVPELLSKQEPIEAAEFQTGDSLAFEYHYRILPEGLLPRFITRTYVHSQGQPRWRTGVVLQFEGNRALIKADPLDNRALIFVTGSDVNGRRRLLAVIRSHFEEIHRSYSFDEPLAMVPVPEHLGLIIGYDKLLAYERASETKIKEFFNGELVELEVGELLKGVDLKEAWKPASLKALRLFYSYSHRDAGLRDELAAQLALLRRRGLIEEWYDREILAGDEWEAEINDNLKRADIILLLVSSDFINSNHCWGKEMTEALKRHNAGEARVIPIIVRDVNRHCAPFGMLQALPENGRAVRRWSDRDVAWKNVADGLEQVIRQLSGRRSGAG